MSNNYNSIENDFIVTKLSIINNERTNNDIKYTFNTKKYLLLAISSICVLLLTVFVFINNVSTGLLFSNIRIPFHIKNSVSPSYNIITTSDSYGVIDFSDYLPWDVIVEPYKQQTITLESITTSNGNYLSSDDFIDITWNINDQIYSTNEISVYFTDLGIYQGNVVINTIEGTYSHDFTIAVKYIRREIRSLTDEDRNKFLDALHTVYQTPTEIGRKKYGSKFKSATTFLTRHLNGAARSDCDHWHDAAGIVNHHVALTLEVEQSLQTIDPSIALPYWEYAMDAFLYDNWQDSPVFNDDWFGDNSPVTEDHSLVTGRWADISTPTYESSGWSIADTGSLNPFRNARGQLRSPWNNNPSNKFSRFNLTYSTSTQMIPSCGSVSSCIKSTSISTMFDCLNGLTHGAVHIMIGGLWSQGDLFTAKPHLQFLESLERLLVFKMLWRNGFSRCPTECNLPDNAPNKGSNDDCKCSVPDDYISTYGAKKILQTTGVWSVFSDQFDKMSDDELYDVLKAIEDPGVAGDMFTSGASFDPIFWPVHGLLERIVGLKRIRVSQKLIHNFDETWGYSTKESHYVNGRCDWTNVKHASDLTLPDCDFSSEAYCWGHEEGDVLEFSNFLGTEDEYTNREFYEFIHPWSEDLPYIYDKYDFDYCVEQGFEIA